MKWVMQQRMQAVQTTSQAWKMTKMCARPIASPAVVGCWMLLLLLPSALVVALHVDRHSVKAHLFAAQLAWLGCKNSQTNHPLGHVQDGVHSLQCELQATTVDERCRRCSHQKLIWTVMFIF